LKTSINEFDFNLPDELIAQHPPKVRGESKLLLINKDTGSLSDATFLDILDYLDNTSFLVVNNTRVMKARLFGSKSTGGKVEVFLLEDIGENKFKALTKGKVKIGSKIFFDKDIYAEVTDFLDDGIRVVQINGANPYELMDAHGHIPLPPYIKRDDESSDANTYQTVYSKHYGSVAAPTAGLHFNEEIIKQIRDKGIEIVEVTLNIGIGTFRPISVDYLEDHEMHYESYEVTEEAAAKINKLKKSGKQLIAVGTTAVRTLESASDENGVIHAGRESTNLFISPGYSFRIVDKMVTNFHLPKSSLFVMLSAFAGKETMIKAYKYAIENKYRFFSYGDATFVY